MRFGHSVARNRRTSRKRNGAFGDVWTWTAIDADTKLVCCWAIGKRDWETAHYFVSDLEQRLVNRIQ